MINIFPQITPWPRYVPHFWKDLACVCMRVLFLPPLKLATSLSFSFIVFSVHQGRLAWARFPLGVPCPFSSSVSWVFFSFFSSFPPRPCRMPALGPVIGSGPRELENLPFPEPTVRECHKKSRRERGGEKKTGGGVDDKTKKVACRA